MLDLTDIAVRIGRMPIIKGVSLTVGPGRWFGLLGANGSGKTTLLRGLTARLEIAGGMVTLGGEDLTREAARRAAAIGFAPHPDTLPGELRGGELLDLIGRARRTAPREPAAIYDALGVGHLEREPIGAMSSGMKQRLCVFSAFVGSPSVVLLDEPFNWLDPVAVYDLKAALRAWADGGGALLTALHDIAAFVTRCDEGVLLHDGRVVKRFTQAELRAGRGDILAFEQTVYETFKAS